MQQALCAAVQKARRIQIISAYFLPPRQIRKALAKAAKRGAIVTLILAAKTDVSLAQSAARRLYTGLLKAGIRIFEYQPQVLHSKLFLFDDAVFVGSANLDKRSLHINYELLVRLETHHITEEARRFFEQALSRSQEITLEQWRKSRSFLTWLREQWAWFLLAQVDPYLAYRQFTWLRGEVLSETRKKK
jgi:cardiolipin synthase